MPPQVNPYANINVLGGISLEELQVYHGCQFETDGRLMRQTLQPGTTCGVVEGFAFKSDQQNVPSLFNQTGR